MNFVYAVPKDAKLHVLTGMDDFDPSHTEVDFESALKAANKWNYGGYHCDMWMNICYRSDDEGIVRCDLLYDVKSSEVIGFLYNSQ